VQWEKIKMRSTATLTHQTKLLSAQMSDIQSQMSQLASQSGNLEAARPLFMQLKSAVASAEAQAEAAEQTVLQQYDAYADEVESLDAHLEWVDWMLDALENASFKLIATESGVAAVEAVWERAGLEPENGILYLTDQRLLWEDRVDDFELKIDVPLSKVEDAKLQEDETSGAQELVVRLGSGAPVDKAFFELASPVGDTWLQMIGRARSGGYEEDRAVKIDSAELERIRNAPSQCENCGGAFTAPILRGQKEITCEFCGVVTRI
jgi:prefoldin subunit 5